MDNIDPLLTTRQLQDLLQVDRITIYRMLKDGRLEGFKVGGQWRFSHRAIERWLQEQRATLEVYEDTLPSHGHVVPSAQTLPFHCIQTMQSVYAEALNVAAVTVDLDGTPLTSISHSCDFCDLILSTAEGRRRCVEVWVMMSKGTFHTCHAGLACISAKIVIEKQWIATAASCQFTQQPGSGNGSWQPDVRRLAGALGLAESELEALTASVRPLSEHTRQRLPRLPLLRRLR